MGQGRRDTLGNLNFASKTGEFYRERIELPFFVDNLKGKGDGLKEKPDGAIPKAWVFETGNQSMRRFSAWPPADARRRSL